MNKKRILLIVTFASLLFLVPTLTNANSVVDLFKQYGEFARNQNTNSTDQLIDVSIDDILNEENFKSLVYYYENTKQHGSIVTTDLNTGETTTEINSDFVKPDIQEIKELVLNRLIDEAVLVEEANKRGITVTDSEVDKVVSKYIEITKEVKPNELMGFIEGLNMTIEEYFYEYAYDGYKRDILIKKLEENIISESNNYEEGINKFKKIKEENIKLFKEENKQLINDLIKSY